MSESLIEKLQYKEEKNILIQGLPSSIEKQFLKLSFAKNVTPLLKSRKIDFALVFCINENQLCGIMKEVLPALNEDAKLWVAYPKTTSKIATDLNRDCSWDILTNGGFEGVSQVSLDHVWSALRFRKTELIEARSNPKAIADKANALKGVDTATRVIELPEDFANALFVEPLAMGFYENLSFTNRKEFVVWINSAKKEETRLKRIESAVEKLKQGKKNPSEK